MGIIRKIRLELGYRLSMLALSVLPPAEEDIGELVIMGFKDDGEIKVEKETD